jgi:twitching motility two-component system response regulator PilG
LKLKRDRCPLCDRELDEFTLQCEGCGGRLLPSAFIDRLGEKDSDRLDRRQIMLAAARYSRLIASDPDDATAHYKLAIAYLNLRHTDAALRCLRRSCELRPDATLAAEINHLSRTQTRANEVAHSEKAMRNSLEEFEAGARQSVLIVDDSPTVRKSVANTLEKCGYQVISAADGHDGLAKIRALKPDVVLLDVVMPRLDGYEVCKTIRESEKDLPIIMLSGKDGLFDKMRGKMAGCTAYLTKPFDNKTLVDTVRKYASAA